MDGKPKIDNEDFCPWPEIKISNQDYIFRQALVSKTNGKREYRSPKEACFDLRPGEDYLSFNIDRFITSRQNYLLLGITKNTKGDFLEIDTFRVFKIPISFVKSLKEFKSVEHSPNYYGAPSPIGKPNNKSHTSLCSNYDVGFRTEMAEYCQKNITECYYNHDLLEIRGEIDQLRIRGNETPFHYNWEF